MGVVQVFQRAARPWYCGLFVHVPAGNTMVGPILMVLRHKDIGKGANKEHCMSTLVFSLEA